MTAVPADAGFEGADESPALPPAPARELRRLMKDWRTGRATKNLLEAFHDAYIVVIAALMIGAMVVNVILKAQTVVASCNSTSCLSARAILPWAAFALAVAAALAASRLFGPVLASAAEGSWLLDTPVSRPALLGRRLVSAIVVGALGGAVIGALVSALTGSALQAVLIITTATALSTAAAVAFAGAQQGKDRRRLTRFTTYVFTLLGIAALMVVIGVAADWFGSPLSTDLAREVGVVVGAVAAVGLVAGAILARVRISRIQRARLVSGGSLIRGVSGAFFALDIGLARDILVARRAMEIGHVKPVAGRGSGLSALIWRELQRVRRFPQPLIVVAGTVIVPYAADALGMGVLGPVFGALALFGALISMLGGLRVLTRSGGMARSLPFSLSQLKLASIAVPAGVAVLWAIAVTAAFRGFGSGVTQKPITEASAMALATAAAGLLGAVRWTQAKGIDFGAPMVSTQAGAIPPGMMTNLFRGFDVVLLVTFPMLLGGSPLWSFAIAAIAAFVLLNSMDAESLRARQAEQQKLLDQQKKEREALRQKKR
ncbi:DUF6297 family protein [Microlunatus ginsengisoli]|uniref:ABC transporter permease n=1 Tax=Microlunatus ginsengisoli TaxID=363863 RepID=A0ABP6ZQ72_9ACTN